MFKPVLIALVACVAASPALAQDEPLQPTGKWQVAFEDSMCVLSRDFGTGEDALSWALRPMPGDPRLEIVITRPTDGKQRYRRGIADLRLEPSHEGLQGEFDEIVVPRAKLFVARIYMQRDAMGLLGTSTSLSMRLQGERTMRIAIPGIGAALKTLKTCEDDLVRRWGFDPDQLATLQRPAKRMSQFDELSERDMPIRSFNPGIQGSVRLRWTAGADGRARDCFVVESSGNSVLDQGTCQIVVTRMRYRPALDSKGQPVDTLDSNTFSWVFPN